MEGEGGGGASGVGAEEDAVPMRAAQGVMKRGFFGEDSAPLIWAMFGPRGNRERECVLFIGTQFSILYTSMSSGDVQADMDTHRDIGKDTLWVSFDTLWVSFDTLCLF